MEVRARGSINPCQLENLRQGGVVNKKKKRKKKRKNSAGLICTSECHCVCMLDQPRVNPETLGRVYHLLLATFPCLATPARKGLLPADPASPPPRLPLCEKSRIPPAEMRKKNTTRSVSFVASTISISLSPSAGIHYASASSPPLVCWRTSLESPTRFCHSYYCSHLGTLVARNKDRVR